MGNDNLVTLILGGDMAQNWAKLRNESDLDDEALMRTALTLLKTAMKESENGDQLLVLGLKKANDEKSLSGISQGDTVVVFRELAKDKGILSAECLVKGIIRLVKIP